MTDSNVVDALYAIRNSIDFLSGVLIVWSVLWFWRGQVK